MWTLKKILISFSLKNSKNAKYFLFTSHAYVEYPFAGHINVWRIARILDKVLNEHIRTVQTVILAYCSAFGSRQTFRVVNGQKRLFIICRKNNLKFGGVWSIRIGLNVVVGNYDSITRNKASCQILAYLFLYCDQVSIRLIQASIIDKATVWCNKVIVIRRDQVSVGGSSDTAATRHWWKENKSVGAYGQLCVVCFEIREWKVQVQILIFVVARW